MRSIRIDKEHALAYPLCHISRSLSVEKLVRYAVPLRNPWRDPGISIPARYERGWIEARALYVSAEWAEGRGPFRAGERVGTSKARGLLARRSRGGFGKNRILGGKGWITRGIKQVENVMSGPYLYNDINLCYRRFFVAGGVDLRHGDYRGSPRIPGHEAGPRARVRRDFASRGLHIGEGGFRIQEQDSFRLKSHVGLPWHSHDARQLPILARHTAD